MALSDLLHNPQKHHRLRRDITQHLICVLDACNERCDQILFLLQQQELSVGAITIALEMEQSAISHQLRTLKEARLVKARREGKTIFYSLDDIHVFSILEQVLTHVREIEDLGESAGL